MENPFTNDMLQKLDCQVVLKKQEHQFAPSEVLAMLEEHKSSMIMTELVPQNMVLTYCFLRLPLKHEPSPGPSLEPQTLKAANVTVYAKLYSSVYVIPFDLYSKCGHKDSFLKIVIKNTICIL
jgi:hypothetical protein